MTPNEDSEPLIVFDGECLLCCANAQFVLRNDRSRRFRLTTAQGHVGQALFERCNLPKTEFETMLLVENGLVWTHSEAAIRIAEGLVAVASCGTIPGFAASMA